MSNCSALAIRMDTARRLPSGGEDLRNWHALEALCFGWVLLLGILFSSGLLGLGTLRHIYLLLFFTFLVNSVRTVVAHRYRNRTAEELSFAAQFLDSVNIEGQPFLMELLAPVGLRYHALHHLVPAMPYHSLGSAHRRLSAQLPSSSIYHAATEPTLRSAFATHWNNTKAAQREEAELASSSYRV
jgi:fatty acid desaturase